MNLILYDKSKVYKIQLLGQQKESDFGELLYLMKSYDTIKTKKGQKCHWYQHIIQSVLTDFSRHLYT